jgi:hypothetical protein
MMLLGNLALYPITAQMQDDENYKRWLEFSPEILAATIRKLIDKKLLHESFDYAND